MLNDHVDGILRIGKFPKNGYAADDIDMILNTETFEKLSG